MHDDVQSEHEPCSKDQYTLIERSLYTLKISIDVQGTDPAKLTWLGLS